MSRAPRPSFDSSSRSLRTDARTARGGRTRYRRPVGESASHLTRAATHSRSRSADVPAGVPINPLQRRPYNRHSRGPARSRVQCRVESHAPRILSPITLSAAPGISLPQGGNWLTVAEPAFWSIGPSLLSSFDAVRARRRFAQRRRTGRIRTLPLCGTHGVHGEDSRADHHYRIAARHPRSTRPSGGERRWICSLNRSPLGRYELSRLGSLATVTLQTGARIAVSTPGAARSVQLTAALGGVGQRRRSDS